MPKIETEAFEPDFGDQIVSFSELDTFRQCPLKHYLGYIMRYSRGIRPGGALAKGSLWHLVMEHHYKLIRKEQQLWPGGLIPEEREESLLLEIRAAIQWIWQQDPNSEEEDEVKSLIEWMYNGYVENYGADLHWKILGVEQKIQFRLKDENGNPTRYVFKAIIDLIVFDRELNAIIIPDHKSGADLPDKTELELLDQFALYEIGLQAMGKAVLCTVHSAARTTRNQGDYPDRVSNRTKTQTLDQRFRRTPMHRTPKELRNIQLDAYRTAAAAYPDPSEKPRRYSSPNPRQCGYMCDYLQPHLAMRRGRPMSQTMQEFGFAINRERH